METYMRNRRATCRHHRAWGAVAALLIVAAGCGSDDLTNIPTCNFLQISAPTANIMIDQTDDLTGTVFMKDQTGACVGSTDWPLDWTVDTSRVTLESPAIGVNTITVRGKAIGTAHITVTTENSAVTGFADIVVSRFGQASLAH